MQCCQARCAATTLLQPVVHFIVLLLSLGGPPTVTAGDRSRLYRSRTTQTQDKITSVEGSAHSPSKAPLPSLAGSSMYITTAVNLDPCESAMGNYLAMLGLKNKEDYARLHGYDFYYAVDQINSTLFGPWNKIKVLQMLESKIDRRQAEWFMWVDNDALFLDMYTTPPFDRYEGKDFVVWGNHSYLYDKLDAHTGLNGGVLLLRNTNWTRDFLAQLAEYGVDWWHPHHPSPFEEEMKSMLGTYHRAFYEQNAIVHLLKKQPELREKVFLETWDYWYFHTHYKYLPVAEGVDLQTSYSQPANGTAYIVHFAGCQFCSPSHAKMEVADCVSDYVKSFGWAYNKVQAMLQESRDFPTSWLVDYFDKRLNVTAESRKAGR